MFVYFFFKGYGDHQKQLVLTPSFPTRRSSELVTVSTLMKQLPLPPTCRAFPFPSMPRNDSCHPPDRAAGTRVRNAPRHSGSAAGTNSPRRAASRSEEHTSELQSLMRHSYAVFCLQKQTTKIYNTYIADY